MVPHPGGCGLSSRQQQVRVLQQDLAQGDAILPSRLGIVAHGRSGPAGGEADRGQRLSMRAFSSLAIAKNSKGGCAALAELLSISSLSMLLDRWQPASLAMACSTWCWRIQHVGRLTPKAWNSLRAPFASGSTFELLLQVSECADRPGSTTWPLLGSSKTRDSSARLG